MKAWKEERIRVLIGTRELVASNRATNRDVSQFVLELRMMLRIMSVVGVVVILGDGWNDDPLLRTNRMTMTLMAHSC